MDPNLFKQGMKKWLTGVSLVTTRHEGAPFGLISTNVCQVGAEPPTLFICVNKAASSHEPILRSGAFCVNVLAASHTDLFDRFLKPARREERFAGSEWSSDWRELPVLAGALVSFQCEVTDSFARETQTIFLGQVRDVAIDAGSPQPMAFFDGKLR